MLLHNHHNAVVDNRHVRQSSKVRHKTEPCALGQNAKYQICRKVFELCRTTQYSQRQACKGLRFVYRVLHCELVPKVCLVKGTNSTVVCQPGCVCRVCPWPGRSVRRPPPGPGGLGAAPFCKGVPLPSKYGSKRNLNYKTFRKYQSSTSNRQSKLQAMNATQ